MGRLSVGGLGPDVSSAQVRSFFEQFYNTVKDVRLVPGRGGGLGGATVTFGFAAERDKAASELNGRELHGHRISVRALAEHDAAAGGAPKNLKRPQEEEIHGLLRQYQTLRAARDYRAADALLQDLKPRGVLVDPRSGTWRSDDGKTGIIPSLPAPVQRDAAGGGGGGGGDRGGGGGALDPAEEARLVCVQLAGETSCGTGTLTRIFTPFSLEVVHAPRDGYATMVFSDAIAAAHVLSLEHYTPTGKRLALLAASQLRAMHEQAAAASRAQAAEAHAAHEAHAAQMAPLPAGWTCGWAAEHGAWYYCNAALNVTQWEPPAVAAAAAAAAPSAPATLVAYSDSEDEDEDEETPPPQQEGAAAPAADADAAEGEGWFYGDPSGAVQGPFSTAQMVEWVKQGALPATTPVLEHGADGMRELRHVVVLAAALPAHVPRSAAATAAAKEAAEAEAAARAEAEAAAQAEAAAAEEAAAAKADAPMGEQEEEAAAPAPTAAAVAKPAGKKKRGRGATEAAPEQSSQEEPPEAAAAAQPADEKAPEAPEAPAAAPAAPPTKKSKRGGRSQAAEPEPEAAAEPEPEPEPAKEEAAAAPEPAPEATPQYDKAQLTAMKVPELKELCQQRGLSEKGKKAELVSRLLE